MSASRCIALSILASLLLLGCRSHPETAVQKPQPLPGTPELRQRLASRMPNAAIGTVLHVLEKERLAAVGDVPVSQFRTGDVVVFLGGEQNVLTTGEVVAIVNNHLHVRFQPPRPDSREPVKGDLVIRELPTTRP